MENINEYCKGVKGLIFDYGGTLDSQGDHWSEVILRGWRHVLGDAINRNLFRDAYVEGERAMARERIILPEDNFRTTLLKKIRVELKKYVEDADALNSQEERAVAQIIATSPESIAQAIADNCNERAAKSVENAKIVLTQLKTQYPMVLVSNFYGNVNSVLNDYDVARYFDDVVESAIVGVRKPDPRIFELGVKALKLRPEEVVVIGDTYSKDIVPALSAGCKAVWIKGVGWTPEEDAREYPYIIKSLDELLPCLLK